MTKKATHRAKVASVPKVTSRNTNTKTATINLRVDPETKARAEKVFAALGVSMSDGIMMFLKQVIHHKGIPFELRVPNKETRRALKDAAAGRDMEVVALEDLWKL